MDVGSLAKKNDGIKFLLVAIDVFSKSLVVGPLKTNTGKEVEAALEDIFRKPKSAVLTKEKNFLISKYKGF